MNSSMEMFLEYKIAAIMRRVAPDKLVPTSEALFEGGIRLIEVTFDQSDPEHMRNTPNMIADLCERFGDTMCIGAGTVLNREQVQAAVGAGAKFVLAPNIDASVIEEAARLGVLAIPGALTPTEVQLAYSLGATVVKLFPTGEMGVNYVKALQGPFNHIPLLAVGGIDETNLISFLQAGMIGAGIGSNIVNNTLIEQGRFSELTDLARKYTSLI